MRGWAVLLLGLLAVERPPIAAAQAGPIAAAPQPAEPALQQPLAPPPQAENPAGGRRLIDEAHLLLSAALLPPDLLNLTATGAVPTAGNGNASRAAPPPPSPLPAANQASVWLDMDGWAKIVPPSFLGISHEWNDVDELVEPEAWQLLKDLQAYGTGPLVLRIGGGSTDLLKTIPDWRVWDTLRRLHNESGMVFILGINFEAGDWSLTNGQLQAIRRELPQAAVLAVELGNEPNFYPNKYGKPAAEYLACCFVNDWNAMAVPLSCPSGRMSCADGQLAGPAWGHVYMAPETLDWFLKVNHRWISMVTIHWYRDRAENYNTAETLLDENEMRADAGSLRRLVETAGKWSKALRVAEMNSISNSGLRGVSDTLSGALWSLDAALEVAASGSTGVNFHWGSGSNVYSAVIRRTKDGKPPIVKPPFYAYALLQMALTPGSRLLLGATPTPGNPARPPSLKVWPLFHPETNTLRVVLINKHASEPAVLFLSANRGHFGPATLLRLTAPGGLSATRNITLGGVAYSPEGISTAGTPRGELLEKALDANGNSAYEVYMPPASAALMIVR
ncbi:hypothetical protein Rsub_02563 [Raphidocelis subcapitata]|uniref:Beta-glucuronidase C-terminal domain-containing protein n=1 Tax=Raphidocelis subcapitata TaxID=307507 RepID=A0A2V0NRB8_9CHLO|nr:hypothetical protein Rsub_02563 [Raphidocelis subcapitata]|eukprot:GBF89859.1 hypothetical protein Rsub_02563 [Raphidocelis subcapitata]